MRHLSKNLISWASILDPQTEEQAHQTAKMPFVFPHLALMPDAHLGKGATVGSVIPTVEAIIPAAVGVDIGCVDADTEYLAPDGWHRIDGYESGEVGQYDPDTGRVSFVTPQRYVKREQDWFYRLKTKYGVDQMLTPDHRMLVWRIEGRNRLRVRTVVTAEEYVAEHARLVQGNKAEMETSFALDPAVTLAGIPMDNDALRVQVMFLADGHIASQTTGTVHVRKGRKVERVRKLLDTAKIAYTERTDAVDVTFRFRPPVLTKTYADLPWPTDAQAAVIADECFEWDGSFLDQVFYTRVKADADYIQVVFATLGHRATLRADLNPDGSTDYRVFAIGRSRVSMAGDPKTPIAKAPSPDGYAYCFTVTTGFLVLRRGGHIFTTGNCGMMALRTQFAWSDIQDHDEPLSALREDIERRIPLSVGKANTETYDVRTQEALVHLAAEGAKVDGFNPDHYLPAWTMQLGTLGSGNHFIEVSLDEDDRVWLFLHSGSRGVGNKIAQKHVKIALEWCRRWHVPLPNPDLAYLVQGTREFTQYIGEMTWAQQYAYANREEMMRRVVDAFAEWIGQRVEVQQEVNCHHNYTTPEHHFGRDVWLSRKGAIDAHEGVWGLIPGSMGARSYVVQGKGNKVALCSAPHGAGRLHSRSSAKRTFTREDLDTKMEGIEWRHTDAFLDEHPLAYKPIDVVMADADDLVTVVHELRQIVNVKGD